jgi:hypothetical protein
MNPHQRHAARNHNAMMPIGEFDLISSSENLIAGEQGFFELIRRQQIKLG